MRRARRAAVGLLCAVLTLAAGFGLLLAATPSISDARARVARLAAAAHAPLLTGALPSRVVAALVATEDSRFYSHHGVDPLGAIRGSLGPLVGSGDQGGATLDQQLSKILYTKGHRSLTDRVEQVALAVKLDAHFSKSEILRMYLNAAYFGHGYQGITEAAVGYFGRAPTAVTWAQAAMLAGLVQAPSLDDPKEHLAAAKARQRQVLNRLAATGRLTRAAANAAAAAPLGLTDCPC